MEYALILIAALIIPYLFGSVSSAVIVCKLMRLPDPREAGSGNPGATNVLRIGNKPAAVITLLGDVLKGFIPVQAAILLGADSSVVAIAAITAFLGHLYPVFFGFKGGKGVATGFGALLALSLPLAIIVVGIWILIFLVFRFSSLAALTAVALGLVYGWEQLPAAQYYAITLIAAMLFWRHRGNIERLVKGTEPQFGKR